MDAALLREFAERYARLSSEEQATISYLIEQYLVKRQPQGNVIPFPSPPRACVLS